MDESIYGKISLEKMMKMYLMNYQTAINEHEKGRTDRFVNEFSSYLPDNMRDKFRIEYEEKK